MCYSIRKYFTVLITEMKSMMIHRTEVTNCTRSCSVEKAKCISWYKCPSHVMPILAEQTLCCMQLSHVPAGWMSFQGKSFLG